MTGAAFTRLSGDKTGALVIGIALNLQENTNSGKNYYSKMNDEIFNKLKKFVTDQGFGYTLPWPFLFKKKKINRDTSLEDDLKITGDDSDEFLIAFGKEFNVDVSKFPIGDYFGDEGDTILPAITGVFTGKTKRQTKKLTIRDLENAVIAGRLDEEVINCQIKS